MTETVLIRVLKRNAAALAARSRRPAATNQTGGPRSGASSGGDRHPSRRAIPRPARRERARTGLLVAALLLAACGGSSPTAPPSPPGGGPVCTGYPDWRSSPYVLPYPVGTAYGVLQGNCSPGSHYKVQNQYGYDFFMQIGTLVTAAREGYVEQVVEKYADFNGRGQGNNGVIIRHPDGTESYYWHLTKNGALVEEGQVVRKGDPIGYSGASNLDPGDTPHLHYNAADGFPSIPVTFRNTDPNPHGLEERRLYPAYPY